MIVKDDELGKAPRELPTMVDYRTHVDKGSMFNTPPVVPIYSLLETVRWVKAGVVSRRWSVALSSVLTSFTERSTATACSVVPSQRRIVHA